MVVAWTCNPCLPPLKWFKCYDLFSPNNLWETSKLYTACAMPNKGAMTMMRGTAPLKKELIPSCLYIFIAQSLIPRYLGSLCPLGRTCSLVFMTSQGVTTRALTRAEVRPEAQECNVLDFSPFGPKPCESHNW